jgi:hypothetical protein
MEQLPLQVFECRRRIEGGWHGALIIAAESEADALAVFRRFESAEPAEVVAWEDVFAFGPARLLHDWP